MKKLLLLLTICSVSMLTSSMTAQAPTTQWSDNAVTTWYNATDATFNLTTANEFAGLSALVLAGNNFAGKTINLSNDIDLSANLWTPIGKNSTITFAGTFDGNNKVISGLFVTNFTASFTGLFGQITGATVKNVRLSNPVILAKDDAGCIAGGLLSNALIVNCHVTGAEINGTGNNIGGLVGSLLTNSTVSKSSLQGNVSGSNQIGGIAGSPYDLAFIEECYASGEVTGTYNVGGIAGYSAFTFLPNRPLTVNNCYSRSAVIAGDGPAAGIYGGASGQLIVKNSYAAGMLVASGTKGGVLGAIGNISAINDYWDTELSATTNAVGEFMGATVPVDITGKTSAEMKTQEFVDMLNMNQSTIVWTIDPAQNDGYPILISNMLAVKSNVAASGIKVYPTLVNDKITISGQINLVKYSLYSISGMKIKSAALSGNESSVEMENLSAGIYLLSVESENGTSTHKLVKK